MTPLELQSRLKKMAQIVLKLFDDELKESNINTDSFMADMEKFITDPKNAAGVQKTYADCQRMLTGPPPQSCWSMFSTPNGERMCAVIDAIHRNLGIGGMFEIGILTGWIRRRCHSNKTFDDKLGLGLIQAKGVFQ